MRSMRHDRALLHLLAASLVEQFVLAPRRHKLGPALVEATLVLSRDTLAHNAWQHFVERLKAHAHLVIIRVAPGNHPLLAVEA
jgi:hypothetical protein